MGDEARQGEGKRKKIDSDTLIRLLHEWFENDDHIWGYFFNYFLEKDVNIYIELHHDDSRCHCLSVISKYNVIFIILKCQTLHDIKRQMKL